MNYDLTISCIKGMRKHEINDSILVVDNKSSNESFAVLTRELTKENNVYVIQSEKNGGYSYGNNRGLMWGRDKGYTYFAIINPDISIEDKNFFKKLIALLEKDQNIAIASGIQVYSNRVFGQFLNYWRRPMVVRGIFDHCFLDFFIKPSIPDITVNKDYGYVDVVSGCCFLIRSDIIDEIGYLDEGVFLFYEENILSTKIHSRGLREAICLNAYFYHNHVTGKTSLKKRMKEKRVQIQSRRYYYRNYVTNNIVLNAIQYVFSIIDFWVTGIIYSCYGVVYAIFKKNNS